MAQIAVTIRLRKKLVRIHSSRRHKMAVRYLRGELARHFKAEAGSVRISKMLNEYLYANSTNRLGPIKMMVERDGEVVKASMPGEKKVVVETGKKEKAKAEAQTAPEAQKKTAQGAGSAPQQPKSGSESQQAKASKDQTAKTKGETQ